MSRHRALVLVASASRFCPVCQGTQRVLVQAIPDGVPVPAPCLHCGRDRIPVAYLPAYIDSRSA